MRYCICGEVILREKKKARREREYCSNKCRQKAYRERSKRKQEREQIIGPLPEGSIYLSLLEDEKLKREILILQLETAEFGEQIYKRQIEIMQEKEAEREAEIIRLTKLLESQARRR